MFIASCSDDNTNPTPEIEAGFSITSSIVEVGNSIQFTDQSEGNPTSWKWTFSNKNSGETTTSTEQNPTITFTQYGYYTVTLEASNDTKDDTEIKVDMITVKPYLSNGLVAYYGFDGNANDFIGDNDGTVSGASLTTDKDNASNSAYSLDGTDDYISFSDDDIFQPNTSDFSISIWVYNDQSQFGPVILKRQESGSYEQYGLFFSESIYSSSSSRKIQALTRKSGSEQKLATSASLANGWHMLTLTFDYDSTTKLYVNGALIDESEVKAFTQNFSVAGHPLEIGRNQDTGTASHFQGKVDDFRFYNRKLSATEVKNLYDNK